MTRYNSTTRHAIGAVAVLAAAALALAGCKSSTSASGSAGSSGSGNSSSSGGSSSSSGGSTTSSSSGGGIPYFPAAVGDTWVYTTNVSSSAGTITNKVTAVSPVSGGQKVTMAVDNHSGDNHSKIHFTYIFHSDGSITVPFSQLGSGVSIKVKSGSIEWPSESDLASGQARHSRLIFMITVAGKTTRIDAKVTVQGQGMHSVTVPAGTYNAQLVTETTSEKFDGVPATLTTETWLAQGVGPIKSEVLSKSAGSSPDTVEELKSFTKG